jgi:hypothetical protein
MAEAGLQIAEVTAYVISARQKNPTLNFCI